MWGAYLVTELFTRIEKRGDNTVMEGKLLMVRIGRRGKFFSDSARNLLMTALVHY